MYPRIHAIHDTFRADTYVLTNTDNAPCRRGESAKRREIERERESRRRDGWTNERPGETVGEKGRRGYL